ncbi:MAG: L-histidine N(alpha)-methyltransferase [bacterium]
MISPSKETAELNSNRVKVLDYLPQISQEDIYDEVFAGLRASQKAVPSKYFYDANGSRLFEQITKLEEYYLSRTEREIMFGNMQNLVGSGASLMDDIGSGSSSCGLDIIELGSGDPSKISILLNAIDSGLLGCVRYIPFDVSESAIIKSSNYLSKVFPSIEILGLVADFFRHLDVIPNNRKRLFCFFGSTLGNLDREYAVEFIGEIGKNMNSGDGLLLGLDMVKDPAIIERAYNDSDGVTACFNVNILHALNSLVGTDFATDSFEHLAFYKSDEMRIEMYLRAMRDMSVHSPNFPKAITLTEGETIHTENCHKFTPEHIELFGKAGGFSTNRVFTDSDELFALVEYGK